VREQILDGMLTSRLYMAMLGAWFVTLCPAIFLLHGKHAAEVLHKVTIYSYAIIVGTRLCNVWFFVTARSVDHMPVAFAAPHPARNPCLLVALMCGALAFHALVHSLGMLRGFWTTRRNKMAVIMILLVFLVGMLHPLPAAMYWRRWYAPHGPAARREAEENIRTTDALTRKWLQKHPDDELTLRLRINFLRDVGRHEEAAKLEHRLPETGTK